MKKSYEKCSRKFRILFPSVVISGSLSPQHGDPQVVDGLTVSSCRQLMRGSPPAWWLCEVLTPPHHKNLPCDESFTNASDLD